MLCSDTLSIADQGLALCRTDYTDIEPIVQISLPFLHLNIRTDHPDYLALCHKALVNNPYYANAETTQLNLVVTDQKSHTHIPRPNFDTAQSGLGALISSLETAGLHGCNDTDHNSWQFFDPRIATGVQLLTRPGAIPAWEQAFPLRNFLHWAYSAQGRRLLHAGTLGIDAKGVLLAGAGGAGKSGTTLAGIINGLKSVGDDYVALDINDDAITASPVINLMKQDPNGLLRSGLSPRETDFGEKNWQGKHEFDFAKLIPDSRADVLQMNAILLPQISGLPHSRLTVATAHEAMLALLPNNLQQLPGQMRQGISFLGTLTRKLPAYHLMLGTDPAEITRTILDFIERDV